MYDYLTFFKPDLRGRKTDLRDREKILQSFDMELYHVLNRGVDKRQIFMDDKDYFRFINNLYELNDKKIIGNISLKLPDLASRRTSRGGKEVVERNLLVDIHAFCLMMNHYHLLLSERVEGGIVKFISKLNMAYAKYFNIKHDRRGALFEARYKSIPVENHAHFLHLPYYIHSNPLDMYMPEWRDSKIRDYKKAMRLLKNYRWSSFPDYIGKQNFPSVTNRDFLMEFFKGSGGYEKQFIGWLKEMELESMKDVLLE
jgi:putative transposase